MPIYAGSKKIKEIYAGSKKVKEIGAGSSLVWHNEKALFEGLSPKNLVFAASTASGSSSASVLWNDHYFTTKPSSGLPIDSGKEGIDFSYLRAWSTSGSGNLVIKNSNTKTHYFLIISINMTSKLRVNGAPLSSYYTKLAIRPADSFTVSVSSGTASESDAMVIWDIGENENYNIIHGGISTACASTEVRYVQGQTNPRAPTYNDNMRLWIFGGSGEAIINAVLKDSRGVFAYASKGAVLWQDYNSFPTSIKSGNASLVGVSFARSSINP